MTTAQAARKSAPQVQRPTLQLLTLAAQTAPYSQEAEEAVIGAVLVNPAAFLNIASFLQADDFFLLRHNYIWQALTRLVERSEAIDYLTVVEELKATNKLEDIGGPAYITQLVNDTPTSAHAEVYGELVARAALRRRLLAAGDAIKALALREDLSIETVITQGETALMQATQRREVSDADSLMTAIQDYWDALDKGGAGAVGIPTGFRDLDDLLLGMHSDDLIVLAAVTGMGKTAMLLSIALNAARAGARVGLFTMEMNKAQITQRLLAMESGINTQKIRAMAGLSAGEQNRLYEAMGRLSKLNVYLDDECALSPALLRAKCNRMRHQHGLDLVLVDYLQLMSVYGSEGAQRPVATDEQRRQRFGNRQEEVSYIARQLKETARRLKAPVLAAAQLNRDVFHRRDNKTPLLSDLRESGAIEQNADVVLFLNRPGYWDMATEFPNQAEITIAKQRNGPTSTVSLYFEQSFTKFLDGQARHIDLSEL